MCLFFFFFNDTATTEIYTLSLHDALPISVVYFRVVDAGKAIIQVANAFDATSQVAQTTLRSVVGQHEMDDLLAQRDKLNVDLQRIHLDRKSTRLNSSHSQISYAVFCLKKK